MLPPHRAPQRYAPIVALVVIGWSAVGFVVSTAQGGVCEFDCVGEFENPHVARIVQGTAYNAPLPFLVVLALAAFLATRPRKGVALAGLGIIGLAGPIQVLAILGEPWAQRALAAPDGMFAVLLVLLISALAMAVFGFSGLVHRARA